MTAPLKTSEVLKMIDASTPDAVGSASPLLAIARSHSFTSREEILAAVSRCIAKDNTALAGEFFSRIHEHPSLEKVTTAGGLPLREHAVSWKLAQVSGRVHEAMGLAVKMTPTRSNYKLSKVTRSDLLEIGRHAKHEIPKIIHQVWIGPKQCPTGSAHLWKEWCAKYGYEYKLWTTADIAGFDCLGSTAYESFYSRRLYAGAVDVVRAEILDREGGLYVDMDMFPIDIGASIHDVFNMTGMICLPAKTYRQAQPFAMFLTNSIMGASPRHPVIQRYRNAMSPTVEGFGGKTSAWWAVGGCLLTSALSSSINVITPTHVTGNPPTKDVAAIYKKIRAIEAQDRTTMFYSTKFW